MQFSYSDALYFCMVLFFALDRRFGQITPLAYELEKAKRSVSGQKRYNKLIANVGLVTYATRYLVVILSSFKRYHEIAVVIKLQKNSWIRKHLNP